MIKKLATAALLLASVGMMNAQAQTVLYSTLSTTIPTQQYEVLCVGPDLKAAVGVRNATETAYKIGSAKVRLYRSNPLVSFAFTVYDDDSGKPGSPIAELGTAPGQAGLTNPHDATLLLASSVTLAPHTSYWIVASATEARYCDAGWVISQLAPTGLLTHVAVAGGPGGQWPNRYRPLDIELLAAVASSPDTPSAPMQTPENGAVTISWAAPADNGAQITKYTVTGVPGGSCTTEIAPPATTPATSCTVTGLTNGTPYKFTVVATNAIGDSTPSPESAEAIPSADLTFVGAGPNITLAGGVVAAAYSQPLQVTGGLPPYNFSVTGELPPGLALNSTSGVISGTPTTPGTYSFSVGVSDTVGSIGVVIKAVHVAEQTFTIVITAAPVVQATPTPVPALGGVGLLLLSGVVAGSMGLMRRRKSN